MDKYIDIVLFSFVCCILFIYVVSYWFSLKTSPEHFCPDLKCDYKLVNKRIKIAFENVVQLNEQMDLIENVMSLDKLEGYQNYGNVYKNLSSIESKISETKYKIQSILSYLRIKGVKVEKANKRNVDCYQLKSSTDCSSSKLKKVLSELESKTQEVAYRVSIYYDSVKTAQRLEDSGKKQREAARKQTLKLANARMNSLFGTTGDNVTGGGEELLGNDPSNITPQKLDSLADMASDPALQKKYGNTAAFRANAEKMYEEDGTNGGGEFGEIGTGLVTGQMEVGPGDTDEDRENKLEAQGQYAEESQEQDMGDYI